MNLHRVKVQARNRTEELGNYNRMRILGYDEKGKKKTEGKRATFKGGFIFLYDCCCRLAQCFSNFQLSDGAIF
jgi:hypothetical protein